MVLETIISELFGVSQHQLWTNNEKEVLLKNSN